MIQKINRKVFKSERVRKMAMTIGGANPYVNTYNRINSASQTTTFQRLSTGLTHPTAAQGASEYAIAARLTSNIGATRQSVQNTQNISSMVKTAEGATRNTVSALETIKQYLVDAANDSNAALDRRAIQENINNLVSQINENASVQYNGMNLLDGSRNTLTVAGIDGYENLQVGDLRSQALGLTDSQGNVTIDVSTPEAANSSMGIVGSALDYVQSVNGDLQASLEGGISIDQALDEATTQGAQLQRLEYQAANYTTMEENQLAALSNGNDVDIARQLTNLHNEQNQEQLALFATRMFNQNRASILNLLP